VSEQELAVIERAPWEETLQELSRSDTKTVRIPRNKDVKRQQVVNAFMDAFQLIGGTPRLAIWADENPTEFYRIYSKLMPKEQHNQTDGEMIIHHVLPKSALD
jgi:hypothetical protein